MIVFMCRLFVFVDLGSGGGEEVREFVTEWRYRFRKLKYFKFFVVFLLWFCVFFLLKYIYLDYFFWGSFVFSSLFEVYV